VLQVYVIYRFFVAIQYRSPSKSNSCYGNTPVHEWQYIYTGETHPPFDLPSNTDDGCSLGIDYVSTSLSWLHQKTADNANCCISLIGEAIAGHMANDKVTSITW